MEEDEDPYESEENWLFDSIFRYKKLYMYELQNPVHLMELTDCHSICVVSSNVHGRFEISEFSLPNKITSELEIEKNVDLRFKCGIFVPSAVSQMKNLKGERKLVTSRENIPGVTLYNLPSDNSTDNITKLSTVFSPVINPFFSLDDKKAILVSDSSSAAILLDLTTTKTVRSFNCCKNNIDSQLSTVFVDSTVFAMCYNNCGSLTVQDLRLDEPSQFVPVSAIGGDATWTVNSTFNCMTTQQPSNVIVSSDNGCILVFDTRNWSTPIHQSNLKLQSNTLTQDHHCCVQFNPSDSNFISLSGYDADVYVFNISDGTEKVFVHDGHRNVIGCDSNTVTRSHAWLPHQKNYLISAAFNKTVQCWQY